MSDTPPTERCTHNVATTYIVMASLSYALPLLQGVPIAAQVLAIIAAIPIAIYAYDWVRKEKLFPGYPLISLDGKTPEESWINFPKETLAKGAQLCPDSPFQVASYTGPKLILPQKYAEEVRVAENVHFTKSVTADLPWSLPGFKAFKLQHYYDRVLPTVIRTKLSLSLNQLTKGIVEETISVIEDLFGEQTRGGEWKTISIRGAAMQIVAQNTLRIMVGEKLCRDPELIDIHTRHAGAVFAAGSEIRAFPTALWPIVHWFLPLPQQLRKQLKRAEEIMGQEVRRREQEARTAIASGQKMAKFGDSVAWHVDVTNSLGVKDYDQTAGQLAFTMAALHNTSTQLGGVMWELCEHPEWIDILRKEVISLVTEMGWTRQTLAKMDLMDAFFKETQTYIRGPLTTVRRYAEKDLVFHDGLTIRKGRRFFLMPLIRIDQQGEFDPYRWVKRRDTSDDPKGLLFVASGLESQTFGLGKHACPGRFFAHDEMKVATALLILKYDWRKLPTTPKPYFGAKEDVAIFPDGVELEIKVRKPEVDLS
ncbi:cytochrome p450 [Fusarium acutatum]|uniref:Cytochrome p450 n=1 Tax=Fusarium acutatum TaxID=78861 RepID=A0A8H4K2A7_9HYPO|nr:cytochrome p450 [Fusarium acutatum]